VCCSVLAALGWRMTNRKLDALFAERVLGDPKPDWQCKHNLERSSPGRAWVCVSDPNECEHDWRPAKFTTSLDAAWAGVEKFNDPRMGVTTLSIEHTSTGKWRAYVSDSVARESTPALALVKACLLAVGVTQEEIDAAIDSSI